MSGFISRRILLAGLLAGAAEGALAGAPVASLRPMPRTVGGRERPQPAEKLIEDAGLGGQIGYVVADARTGQVLESRNPALALPPASVAKSVTALYALDRLGAGFRFSTRLMATGPVRNGRLAGDLVLVGSGDPTLNTDDLGDMAKRLKALGVHEVTGRFQVFSGALPYIRSIDTSQHHHLSYSPAISGLNLNYNRVHFEWKRVSEGFEVTLEARARKFRPRVTMAKMAIVNRDLPVYTYADEKGVESWTVAQGALGKGGARWLPVRRPEKYAAEVFRTLARSYGIVLSAPVAARNPPNGITLIEQKSPEAREILRGMLKFSNNLTAEVIGMTASREQEGRIGSLAESAKRMSNWLSERTANNGASFVDHSGLADTSRISADNMVRALILAGPKGQLRAILKDFPMTDNNGKPIKGDPLKIRAKTGTLNFVSALAGYVSTPDGTELVFAIFTADTGKRAKFKRPDGETPPGARRWGKTSRRLQQDLIQRWATVYSG